MSEELFYRKRCKRLGIALASSAFLNISILAFGIYEWQETGFSFLATSSFRPQKSKLYRQTGKELPTLTQVFRELESLDYNGLVVLLDDTSLVAEGYKKQDLALSMLVKRHYFDSKRALGTDPLVKRLFSYMAQDGQASEIILYPDLAPEQLALAKSFAKTEKWPITTEGLLVRYRQEQSPELKGLILSTDEYRSCELLLTRATPISRDAIFEFATQVDYKLLKSLYEEMAKSQDFSPEVRRGFLLNALPHSAAMLFQVDPRFCTHSLRDKYALILLAELEKKPDMAKEYALALLEAPRSNVIWKKAIIVLATIKQLDPQTQTRTSILELYGRIVPKVPAKPVVAVQKPQTKKQPETVYIVQSGDTLWHISKRFGVDIDKIKKHNKLTSDALKPGSMLRIPPKEQKGK